MAAKTKYNRFMSKCLKTKRGKNQATKMKACALEWRKKNK